MESSVYLHSKSTIVPDCARYGKAKKKKKTIFFALFSKTKLTAIILEGCKYYKKRRLAYREGTSNSDVGVELGNALESFDWLVSYG